MKILLLAGGDSNEREVSLASGKAIYEALLRLDHKVFVVDPATGKSLIASDGRFMDFQNSEGDKITAGLRTDIRQLVNTIASPGFDDIEVVYLALHGGYGENGTLQCLLEIAGKKFTGSNMTASAIAMDKTVSKTLFESVEVATPHGLLYRLHGQTIDDRLVHDIAAKFHFPVIVKPNDGGSTIGLTKVKDESGLQEALCAACKESTDLLIEDYVSGREMTVAVVNGKAFSIVEIKPKSGLYDYASKYTRGESEYFAPADISEKLSLAIRDAAVKAFNVIGAWGLARVDFMLCERNGFYCLELNTLPGMTELSLAPMSTNASGMEFDELVSQVLKAAITGK